MTQKPYQPLNPQTVLGGIKQQLGRREAPKRMKKKQTAKAAGITTFEP